MNREIGPINDPHGGRGAMAVEPGPAPFAPTIEAAAVEALLVGELGGFTVCQ